MTVERTGVPILPIRRSSAADHTKIQEHGVAAAEKELGIDNAEVSKQQEIDRANKVESSTYTDIDITLQLPWSPYLVDAAKVRLAWWNTASTQYANLASDRNTAETTYTGRLATAHVSRQQLIATARKCESIIDANSGAAQASAQADAVRDYFTNMVAPTKTYVDALASAQRTKAVAQANRDYIDNERYSQRQNDIQTANDTFDSTQDDKAATYRSVLAGARIRSRTSGSSMTG